jgi:hypothetical protein
MVQFTSNKDTYYGVIYNINGSDKQPAQPSLQSSDTVVEIKNACIYGSIVIDGPGGLEIGSNNGANYCNGNMQYDANVANRLRAFGTAGIVQNSFREISATS